MKYVTASELKRRGVVVLEEQLQYGVVQVMKNSKVSCVVMTEAEYEALKSCCAKKTTSSLNLSSMLKKPATGKKTPKTLHKMIEKNKKEWGK